MQNLKALHLRRGCDVRQALFKTLVQDPINIESFHRRIRVARDCERHPSGLRHEEHVLGPQHTHTPLRIHSDATAAIGIARRRGLGKLRHLDVEDLWVQEKVRNKDVEIVKVLGTDNPADIFTKYVDAAILNKALLQMGLRPEAGRPKASSSITTGEKQ